MTRIAIVDSNKCKPEKCSKECIKSCPPQKTGTKVIEIEDLDKIVPNLSNSSNSSNLFYSKLTNKKKIAKIVESLCIGCNQCVNRCPFNAIKIVNLPDENSSPITHRYGLNGFRLYGFPILKQGKICGIIGSNGVGKTTLIDIIGNKFKPNFEQFNKVLSDKEIINNFKGTIMQDYFKNLLGNKLLFSIKEQKIKLTSTLTKKSAQNVQDYLNSKSIDLNIVRNLESFNYMEIEELLNLNFDTLSGGQLQRLKCWETSIVKADVYIFDEPTNFLDISQRLNVSKMIRTLSEENPKSYIIVIEHDLSILDWISDELYIIYGKPTAFGIVSKPLTTLEGINMYLSGYISTQNIRFREQEFNFRPPYEIQTQINDNSSLKYINYESSIITFPNFNLTIPEGKIKLSGTINVVMGENGTGKTTFINWLSKNIETECCIKSQMNDIIQYANIDNTFPTVLELFDRKIRSSYWNKNFKSVVSNPLEINLLESKKINELSGGELQRVLIVLCLGSNGSIYLLDEPSANLDIEKRLIVIKVIKRFVSDFSKTVFVIEHDIAMCVGLGQEPSSQMFIVKKNNNNNNKLIKNCEISNPMDFFKGINGFLKLIGITMRISSGSANRPRINKLDSQLDKNQRTCGNYYGI